ncbi:MAG: LacI family DNA-binding transcriptional regulator, partial [Pseudomonadota bacterium]
MSEQRPIPTLIDVAKAAGVSTATVSRCLNTPDRVAQKTRDNVQAAVDMLGYTPNFGARAMAAKRTNTIGAIIPTMENAIFARGLQAFQDELRLHGYTMLVASSNYDPAQEVEQIKSLVTRGADALLLIGTARDAEIYNFLQTQMVPALITWAHVPGAALSSVGFDNEQAMSEMAAAVIAQGHRRLGLLSGPTKGNDRAAARLAGVRVAMQTAGLKPDNLLVIEAPYAIENGGAGFAQLMRARHRPTAVLCGNDVLAVGALREAQAMGMGVPNDISIVGFDDIELAQVAHPPLTTVHVPHR